MTEPTDAMAERVADLETRLAHFEAMADELSSVVAEQGRLIDRLTARLQAATERLEEMAASLPEAADDRPPPHY
jgi:SlyX protein